MWTMGTDFRYQYAHTWFRQMDKFIHYVNQVSYDPYFLPIPHDLEVVLSDRVRCTPISYLALDLIFMLKYLCGVLQDGRVNALYSTPSIYTDAKYALNQAWPLKNEDYFP